MRLYKGDITKRDVFGGILFCYHQEHELILRRYVLERPPIDSEKLIYVLKHRVGLFILEKNTISEIWGYDYLGEVCILSDFFKNSCPGHSARDIRIKIL